MTRTHFAEGQVLFREGDGFSVLSHFQLFNECSEVRRDGSRQSVVLILQESPNYQEGNSPIASGIDVALRGTRGNIPMYPIIDPISCGSGLAHGPGRRSPPPVPRQHVNV